MKLQKIFTLVILVVIYSCSKETPVVEEKEEQEKEVKVLTGIFKDSEVSGLSYSTLTQEGITNADGQFKYKEGEIISFSLGKIELGKAVAQAEMTPVTIAKTPGASIETDDVKNIAALLQTLDSDHDLSNGIEIQQEVIDAIKIESIDFTKPIIRTLGEIVANVNQATKADLIPIYPEKAAVHLAETLGETYESENILFKYFLPVIEGWKMNPRSSVHWIHNLDKDGRIEKSFVYEKYPYELIWEYTYLKYASNGLPEVVESVSINGGDRENAIVFYYFLEYSEDNSINAIGYNIRPEEQDVRWSSITGTDHLNRITELKIFNEDGTVSSRTVHVLDSKGNKQTNTIYRDNNEEPTFFYESEFTEFGDWKIHTETFGDLVRRWEYFYRNDFTLKKSIFSRTHSPSLKVIKLYNELEETTHKETYNPDFLIEAIDYHNDGSSERKVIDEDDQTYFIEYTDGNGDHYKTEFYDADGSLISTEEY